MAQKRFGRIVGNSAPMRHMFRMIQRAAEVDLPLLIIGEPGTGKELVAREVHRRSNRMDGPFVTVDLTALQPEAVYGGLFGHDVTGQSGEDHAAPSYIEQAHGGMLHLDEPHALDNAAQAMLLRVLEEGGYRPTNTDADDQADIRIVASTSVDLDRHASQGRFREDLLLRLEVLCIAVPPLRERKGDIAMLADAIVEELAGDHGIEVERISASAYETLEQYPWPGNVRELQNVLTQAAMAAGGGVVRPEHLAHLVTENGRQPPDAPVFCLKTDVPKLQEEAEAGVVHLPGDAPASPVASAPAPAEGIFIPLGKTFDEAMRAYAEFTLGHCGHNKTKAAQLLGVSRKTLYERLARWEKGMAGKE